MSPRSLKKVIWREAKKTFNNPKLRLKDIREWSSSEGAVKKNLEPDEVMAQVGEFWVAVFQVHDKR